MRSTAATVDAYLTALPVDRRELLQAVRQVILRHLPAGYAEGMQYGMIGYFVPHARYPAGYHCDPRQPLPFAALASQKQYCSLYLMCIYSQPEHRTWFQTAWAQTGRKLNMGKSCIRFRHLDDLPLEVIGQAIARVPVQQHIAFYEQAVKPGGRRTLRSRRALRNEPEA